jgi:tripartite-type tricarboxylate transporter receptor subunit TctC
MPGVRCMLGKQSANKEDVHMRSNSISAAIAAALVVTSGAAYAQTKGGASDYPNRPIRFIVPAAPGGTTDGLARIFGTRMSEIYKQQVIVDNRASASGVVAGELTAQATPDGYTIFLPYHQHTINAALQPKLPYHPVNDFTPITTLTHAALLLVVHPSTPVKDFKEFLNWTRTSKGTLNFGSAGIGSGGHLAGELYNLMAKVKSVHIPYKGTGPATAGLLGREYHYNFMGLLAASQMHRDGRLRAIAITSLQRNPALADIPTVAESGLPGFEVVGWYGVMAPPRLPKPIVASLHSTLVKILKEPDVQKIIYNQAATPIGETPEEFRKFLHADLEKWRKVVQASGAKPF